MLVSVLCSGSKGNSTLIKSKNHNILIDAGMNYKYIKEKLLEHNTRPEDIDYIFLTHTHKDHISALKTFIKKHNPIICMGENMFLELDYLNEYKNIDVIFGEKHLDTLHVDMIKTSHDAADARGYIFTEENKSIVYITDTGYIHNRYFQKLYNKNVYIFESNHDTEMLMHGKYPKWLQARILGDKGHLSNEMSAFYLSRLIGNNTKKVILAHLSEENNTELIALKTLKDTLIENNVEFKNIDIAKQHESTKEVRV